MTNKVVVIYSGGMDSFTLMNQAIAQGKRVYALSFNYGQKHSKELHYAQKVCDDLGLPHKIVDITPIHQLLMGSSLTDDIEIPEGHYEEESMKSTVVPNRNMIMLSLAIAYAVSIKAEAVYYGAHGGDHAIYPDCRPEFIAAFETLANLATKVGVEQKEKLKIHTPLIQLTKAEIILKGVNLGLDYSLTHSCYNPKENGSSCGSCDSCQLRLKGFKEAGLKDPIEYTKSD